MKLSSIAEQTKICEQFNLCDIFRIRNTQLKRYTYRQTTPSLRRRLDYFIVSNSLQTIVKDIEAIASLSSDHSPVLI